jgi:hypothetical protein
MIVTSLSNPYQDTRSPEDKFFSELARKKNDVPDSNASNVASAKFRFWDGNSDFGALVLVSDSNGFRYYPADGGFFLNFSQNPTFYKLTNVNAVLLRLSFLLQVLTPPLGFSFVADTNYSVDFYLSLFAVNTDNAIQPDSFSIYRDELISVKITITHQKDGTNPTIAYSLNRRIVTLNLSDYILSRPTTTPAGGFSSVLIPDFNVDPEKITLQQYENLLTQDLGIYAFFGYDITSYESLIGKDKVHFDLLFANKFRGESDNFGNLAGTSATATTLTYTTAGWAVNQWAGGNYQARIVSGTGAGQSRIISSNTATTLTLTFAWTTIPDGTSYFAIENLNFPQRTPLQFAVDGTLNYFGLMASYTPINS